MSIKPKSLILVQIEEILRRKLSSALPLNISNAITLEAWLQRAADYIYELEQDAPSALSIENLKRINNLERIISDNNEKYIRKEKDYVKIMLDLRRRLQETYERLPVEEKLKSEFICFLCNLPWDREFLGMTDKQGNNHCWDCVESGMEKAGDEIGQVIKINSTPKSAAVKFFTCGFCNLQNVGKPIKTHITNAPDGRDNKDIIKLCESCSATKAKKNNSINYCPRLTRPRDTFDGPEYDCNCSPKDKYQDNW